MEKERNRLPELFKGGFYKKLERSVRIGSSRRLLKSIDHSSIERLPIVPETKAQLEEQHFTIDTIATEMPSAANETIVVAEQVGLASTSQYDRLVEKTDEEQSPPAFDNQPTVY